MNKIAVPFLLLASFAALAQQRPPAAVETSPVEKRALAPHATVTGQVRSRASADLSAGIAGTLAWVAEPGTRIARDGVVARLDTDEMALQKLEQVARVKRGEISQQQLAREAKRLEALGTAVSKVALEQAESQRDLAAADLDIARATLRQIQQRLSRAELRSPFGGVVADRLKRAGEEVNRGEVVARMLDPETLEVRLFLPLRHVRAIKPGDNVTVRFDGGEGQGRVRNIVPAGDARSQSFEVLVDLPPARGERKLPSGSMVEVVLPLGEPSAQLAVPRDALIIRADGLAVYRIGPDNQAQRVKVTTGMADGEWVAVEGPLLATDSVVVRGGENLQDGATVKIVGTRTTWTSSPVTPVRSSR
ncbi:MAG TPA: efflux RND transporter periplasmic adaptor subunit [Verrucomicrobiae bacterium]|nr:efflux RND transporter periplasmic adaptor subunit [Verrucomicrobiae bacterium]